MNSSSGILRSRFPSAPSSPLTDRKIDAYILAGRYGEEAKKQLLAKKKKPKKGKKREVKLYKDSSAIRSLNSLL